MKARLVFIVFLFQVYTIAAQHLVYKQLTKKEGLPDIEFYDMLEDHEGFIWLASYKGLYRYDGKNYKYYTTKNKNGLSVFDLKLDTQGRVWCTNISGQFFYVENDSLQLFKDFNEYTKGEVIEYFFYKNKLYISSGHRALEIDVNSKKVVRDFITKGRHFFKMFQSKDTIFYIRENQIDFKTSYSNKIIKYQNIQFEDKKHITHKIVALPNAFLLQSQDVVNYKQRFYLKQKGKFKELSKEALDLDTNFISVYAENDMVWFTTFQGVYLYRFIDGQFDFIDHYFDNFAVTNMFKDSGGNYWFSTLKNGVFIVPNIHVKKYRLRHTNENINTLEKLDSTSFLYGNTSGEVFKLPINSENAQKITEVTNQKVNKILKINNDIIVSYKRKSEVLNRKTFRKKKSLFETNTGNAKGLAKLSDSTFVFSGYIHAFIADLKNNIIVRKLHKKRSYTAHVNTKDKNIYVGYIDGLRVYDSIFTGMEISFKNNPIFALDIDNTNDGTVWVSTFTNGILGVKNNKVIFNYNETNGLLSNQTSIVKADGDKLWIVTEKGIQVLNTVNRTFKSLTSKDGVDAFNIIDLLVFDDDIIFNTSTSLYKFNKTSVFKKTTLPKVYFTSISIQDTEVALKTKYDLESGISKIKLQFHSNGYLSDDKIDYYYKLEGADDKWSKLTSAVEEIVFNNLSEGSYTVKLKAKAKSANQEIEADSIHIKINAPIYKRWWFILGCFLIVLVLLWIYFIQRIKHIRKRQKNAIEKERIQRNLVASRLESLRSQMNPHFIFNALNSIQEYIVLNKKDLASKYLIKFSNLMRMYLEHSQTQYVFLYKEIEALRLYLELENNRFRNTISYTIEVAEEVDEYSVRVPSIFIQPYVENAIKHGLLHKKDDRKLSVSFSVVNTNVLKCCIVDNGIGRAAAGELKQNKVYTQHQSYATKANQNRVDLINLKCTHKIDIQINDLYENKKPSGTEVVITIPIESL